jgi:hypothetical protein
MRDGAWEGHPADDPEFRALFTRDAMLASDWYRARLEAKREIDARLWEQHARYLEKFLQRPNYADVALQLGIREKLERVSAHARATRDPAYADSLAGTTGAEPAIATALDQLQLR